MGSELLLRCDSPTLVFPFELNKRLSSSIKIQNDTDYRVAYKFNSNNHKRYGVQPKVGFVEPNSTLDITVTTRARNNGRCKDKFMIRTIAVTDGPVTDNAQEIFRRDAIHGFQEYKLRVAFRNPTEISSLGPVVVEISNAIVSEVTTSEPNDNASQQASTMKLLNIEPSEIQFTFELNKELSSSLQLSNMTDNPVAFMVTTSGSNHLVEPSKGLIPPQSTTSITVKMRLKLEFPSHKLLVQSIVADTSVTTNDIDLDTFTRSGSSVQEHEVKMNYTRVVESILRGVVLFVLMIIVSWYFMKMAVSFIWTLVMIAVMLITKMVKRHVSDSVEDWIVKTLLCICRYLFFGRKANIDW